MSMRKGVASPAVSGLCGQARYGAENRVKAETLTCEVSVKCVMNLPTEGCICLSKFQGQN
jgi:hypothetical protein